MKPGWAHVSKGWMIGLSVLSTCVTKQTKDMRYSELERKCKSKHMVDILNPQPA